MTKLTVSTIVNAPVEKVRNARTNPEDIMQWNFASDDWCCPASTNDVKVGGLFSATMAAKDGSFSFDFAGQYDIVEPLSKIAYTM